MATNGNNPHQKDQKNKPSKKQIRVRVISVIGAIILYALIAINQQSEKVFSCKLKIEDLSSDLVITSNIPEYIKITVRDKAKNIDSITDEDFNVRLNFSKNNQAKLHTMKVEWDLPHTISSFTNSLMFSSVELNPTKIDVNLETLAQKTVPIQISTIGTVPDGYKIKERSQDIYYARIQGPEKIINEIGAIKTSAIDLTNQVDSFKQSVTLVSPTPFVTFVSKSLVEATFKVAKSIETATFVYEEIELNNVKRHLSASYSLDSKIVVTISGEKNVLSTLSKNSVIVNANCSSISYPGEYSTRIDVSVPQNVQIVSIKPDVVKLKITENEGFRPPPRFNPPVVTDQNQ